MTGCCPARWWSPARAPPWSTGGCGLFRELARRGGQTLLLGRLGAALLDRPGTEVGHLVRGPSGVVGSERADDGPRRLVARPRRVASWRDAATATIASVVAMVPLGLVLMTSITFAVGAVKLARQQVLVQELPAVEGLARVDIICLDKTGTLTQGDIVFDAAHPLSARSRLGSGAGVVRRAERRECHGPQPRRATSTINRRCRPRTGFRSPPRASGAL